MDANFLKSNFKPNFEIHQNFKFSETEKEFQKPGSAQNFDFNAKEKFMN